MATSNLTAERLRSVLAYDAHTGEFVWLAGPRKGRVAGSVNRHGRGGRVFIAIGERKHLAHRLAWLWVYGTWPTEHIDHIDGNAANNRIANLRDVSQRTNLENQRRATLCNKSGFLGVHSRDNRWRAQIKTRGKTTYLGYFDSAEAAHAAYVEAKRKLHDGCTL